MRNVSADEITATGYRTAGMISVTLAAPSVSLISRLDDLSSKKRHAEAAVVLLHYASDLREAVIALV
jgi:vacuolar-type H+-ATPase subunit F/Vma7